MNILITGAFGFVGSNLSAAFKKDLNCHLVALDVNKPDKHIYDSFLNWQQIQGIHDLDLNAIIHLAGKAHDTKKATDEKVYFDVNLGLTKQIFDFFLQSSAEKFVFFSSVKAVADKVNGSQLKEDIVPDPQSPYGKSKLAAENYILSQKLPINKRVYISRPCMIHGPGNKGNLNLLYNIVQKKIPWPLGRFQNLRSFTSIDNLSFGIIKILREEIEPGVYNMADDNPISTNRLIQLIGEPNGNGPVIWNINKRLLQGLAKAGNLFHLPLNSERLEKLTESYVVSNNKLKKALNIEYFPLSVEEGLRKTLQSFNNR